MAGKEYIERNALISDLNRFALPHYSALINMIITKQPTADVVDAELFEQLKWERDLAIEQLESYGVCLGEKAELVRVKHGEWIERIEKLDWCEDDVDVFYECSQCGTNDGGKPPYCPNCGARMDGGKTDDK